MWAVLDRSWTLGAAEGPQVTPEIGVEKYEGLVAAGSESLSGVGRPTSASALPRPFEASSGL